MTTLAVFRVLLVCISLSAPVLSQQPKPRFTLPATPYDYTATAVSFPERDNATAAEREVHQRLRERSNHLAALGRVLFHDPLLSRNRSRSCASCHEQARAFADGEALSEGFAGRRTKRNSMSIANLADHRGGFFWDARARTLQQMVLMPIQDPIEMGMELPELCRRLAEEPGYAELFENAFGDRAVTDARIAQALARFVAALESRRSKYDEGLAAAGHDVDKPFRNLTAAENRGKALFFGKIETREQSCAACHVHTWRGCCSMQFDTDRFLSQDCRNNGLDAGRSSDDPGFARVTGKAEDRGKFRAPSLRNVELTGPYMHDGRFATLEEVVAFYAHRMHAHPNLDPVFRPEPSRGAWGGKPAAVQRPPESVAGPAVGVPMTRAEQADLVAFLKTLTDRHFVSDPRFADPFAKRP